MKRALSCEGLGQVGTLEELAALAAGNGFDAIDAAPALVREAAARRGVEGVSAFLTKLGVSLGSFPSSGWWIGSAQEFRDSITTLNEDAKLYAALGCGICHTFIMPSCEQAPLVWAAVAAKRIRLLAGLLEEYGIRLALEYVGPHPMRRKLAHPFLWSIRGALDFISLIRHPNVGLLLDSFHWYTAEETTEDIRAIPPQLLFHVHVNDAPDLPVAEIEDNNRLYPGEGVIDLASFMAALHGLGYNGIVAQEVLTPHPVQTDNATLAANARKAFDKLFLM